MARGRAPAPAAGTLATGSGGGGGGNPRDSGPTTYLVLRQVQADAPVGDDGEAVAPKVAAWTPFKQVEAQNKGAAIRKATTNDDDSRVAGVFKAVALSAWAGGEAVANETKVVPKVVPYADDDLKGVK